MFTAAAMAWKNRADHSALRGPLCLRTCVMTSCCSGSTTKMQPEKEPCPTVRGLNSRSSARFEFGGAPGFACRIQCRPIPSSSTKPWSGTRRGWGKSWSNVSRRDELPLAVAAAVGDPLGQDAEFPRGELAVGTGVADRHVAKAERAKEMFVVQPDGALAGDEFHRLGGQFKAQAAVGVLDVRFVHVDPVQDDVLQVRIAHAAEVAVSRQAARVVEALPERGHVGIVLADNRERPRTANRPRPSRC